MSMISCSECGRDISDKASSCPGCGAGVTTIEKTGKEWKGGQMLGAIVMLIGILIYWKSSGTGGQVTGGILGFCGVIGSLGSQVGAWWHHG